MNKQKETKEKVNVLANWKAGDDTAAVAWLAKKHRIEVTTQALLQWRQGGGSKLTPFYIQAYKAVQARRRRVAKISQHESLRSS